MCIYPYLQRANTQKGGSGGPSTKASTTGRIVLSKITSAAKEDLISAFSDPIYRNIFNIWKFLKASKSLAAIKLLQLVLPMCLLTSEIRLVGIN